MTVFLFSSQARTVLAGCSWLAGMCSTQAASNLAVSNLSNHQEFIMSARNGDKSRFHRERKQKIARRKRTLELLQRTRTEAKTAGVAKAVKPTAVSA